MVWRRRHNEELKELTGVPWITDIIKSNKLRWAGHVARQEKDAIPKMAMRGHPEGRRPVGRPRKRWKDGVVQDLRQIGHDSDWMETAQNRERWRTVVAAARGLHGLQPAELSIIQDTSMVSIECVPAVTEYVSKILDSSSVLTYRYTARPSLLFE